MSVPPRAVPVSPTPACASSVPANAMDSPERISKLPALLGNGRASQQSAIGRRAADRAAPTCRATLNCAPDCTLMEPRDASRRIDPPSSTLPMRRSRSLGSITATPDVSTRACGPDLEPQIRQIACLEIPGLRRRPCDGERHFAGRCIDLTVEEHAVSPENVNEEPGSPPNTDARFDVETAIVLGHESRSNRWPLRAAWRSAGPRLIAGNSVDRAEIRDGSPHSGACRRVAEHRSCGRAGRCCRRRARRAHLPASVE